MNSDILSLKDVSLNLTQDENFELIIKDLQNYTSKYLYTKDGFLLSWFNDFEEIPPAAYILEMENKNLYYIRNSDTSELLCCSRKELADAMLSLSTLTKVKFQDSK